MNKKVGITLSVIVICAVVFTIVFAERKAPVAAANAGTAANAQAAANNQNSASNSSVQSSGVTTTGPASETNAGGMMSSGMPPADMPKSPMMYAYKNGTYSATGSYMSPGGEDQISVTLTLKNDTITDVSVTPAAGDRTSERYQNRFISGYKQYVIGKNIADVQLTAVSGSSLTPIGFNDALAQIKAQAKA